MSQLALNIAPTEALPLEPLPGDLYRFANVSPDKRYRYGLSRSWVPDPKREVMFVGLNPSTADAKLDDPTLRRCIRFAKDWGYDGLWLGNLYAFRATDPKDLPADLDEAVGGEITDNWLRWMRKQCEICVVAWGAHAMVVRREPRVLGLLGDVRVLGLTAAGFPRHPLYMRADSQPRRASLDLQRKEDTR